MTKQSTTEPDDMADLSSAEMIAFLHQEYGDEAVTNMLEILINPSIAPPEVMQELKELHNPKIFRGFDRESLELDADELGRMRLPVADLVAQAASQATPERELLCPYQPEDHANWECWQANYSRRHPNG